MVVHGIQVRVIHALAQGPWENAVRFAGSSNMMGWLGPVCSARGANLLGTG